MPRTRGKGKGKSKGKSKSQGSRVSRKNSKSLQECLQMDTILHFIATEFNKDVLPVALNKDEKAILDEYTEKLKKIKKIKINAKGFKTIVIKLVSILRSTSGGDGSEELVEYGKSRSHYKYDLFAVIGFVSAIVLLYASYIQFTQLSDKVSQHMDPTHKTAFMQSMRELPEENQSFMAYIINFFTSFGCGFIEARTEQISNLLTTIIKNSMSIALEEAKTNCLTQNDPYSFIGVMDIIGRTFDPASTNSCIMQSMTESSTYMMQTQTHVIKTTLMQISTQTGQIYTNIIWASRIGGASTLYILNRLRQRQMIAYRIEEIE